MNTDHLPSYIAISVQQTDRQSGDNMANLQDCNEVIATSADDPSDPLNTSSHTEATKESLTSGNGVPAAEQTDNICDGTEETGSRPSSITATSITTSSRLNVSSAIRSSATNKYSGWFQCTDCGQKLRGKAKLSSHMKLLHKGSSVTKTVVKRKTSWFKCGVCGKKIRGKKNLTLHGFFAHNGQTGIKSFAKKSKVCSSMYPPCSAVFADSTGQGSSSVEKSNTEVKHLRLGPWFTCRSCDHIFKGRSQLQEHVKLKHQGFNEAQTSMSQISAKSEQSPVDRNPMGEAASPVTELAPECPVTNHDGESVVDSNGKKYSRTKHQIWHQCDLCRIKVKGTKKLQRHLSKCKGKQTTTPAVTALRTNFSASETNAMRNRSWYKCKHCCKHLRGRKRFMQHICLCVRSQQNGAALWHRLSDWKQCAWYKCSGCRRTFKGKQKIRLHALECHTEAPSSCTNVETDMRSFGHTCTLCHKHFQRRLFLDKHMRKCPVRQKKINLSEHQASFIDVQSSEQRLGQEQGESGEVEDSRDSKGQTEKGNYESWTLSDPQSCNKTQVDGDTTSDLTLVFLQDGSWYRCQICGQNLHGKEQIKKHSHDQNNKKTENEDLESVGTTCLESEFLKVGTWHRCKICGKNLRGKEQVKNHSHDHKIEKPEQQESHDITCLESDFLKFGSWRKCKICGENLRGREQMKSHSHDLKVVNPGDDAKPECTNPSSPCLDFVQVGTWYSCKVCGQKLQGRKQMQAHSHSQVVDKDEQSCLDSDIQNGLRSVEDGFIQVGSWYRCKSCLVQFRGRHSAELHHRYKCSLGEGVDCRKVLLPDPQPEHCRARPQGQDGRFCHGVQPASDDNLHDIHQPTGDDIADDVHQPTNDDIAHNFQPTGDDNGHDIHQPTGDKVQHDVHQPTSDVQRHGENEQCVNKAESSTVPANLAVRDYMIKTGKSWECCICSKMIQSWIGAFKHVKSHFTRNSLNCSICNKSFSSSWNCRKHEQIHNRSSALKKCSLKKSTHSGPLQKKTMNPSYLTSRNRTKFSKQTTAPACSQKTNAWRPHTAVDREYEAQKEVSLKGFDLKPASAGDAVVDADAEEDDVDRALDVNAVADADTETPALPCNGTSEDNRDKWHKVQNFKGSSKRDKSETIVYVDNESFCPDNDSGTDVSLDQTYLCNDYLSSDDNEMTSELYDASENEGQAVEDVQCDDWILFSENEDDNPRDDLNSVELYEDQQKEIMSDGAKAPTETEYHKLYQTFVNLSAEVNPDKQKQDNNNQESMEKESTNSLDSNVALSDVSCLSRTLLERSDTDSHDDEGLSESRYGKVAVVQDCSLDADLVMSDVCRFPDLAWSDDDDLPLTDVHKDISKDYDTHKRKKETLNISRRRISQEHDRSQNSQIFSHMLHERTDVMDSARAERKNLPNSKHGKNRTATSTKYRMNTTCKPKQSYDMYNLQLMPSGDSERLRKHKEAAPDKYAGEGDDKQTDEGHGHMGFLECLRTSSGQIDFVDASSDGNRKTPTLYKTRNELYVPERVRFERGQEEKRHFRECVDVGDNMFKGRRGMSVKASDTQSCDRSADRDQKSRQGRYVCSLCYKAFTSEEVAVDHLKQHVSHQQNRARNIRQKNFKKCRVCQRVFTNQGDLEFHEHGHSVEDTVGTLKCVKCEICGERYRTQKLLDQHKIGHQVWLKCSHCNLYFAKVSELHQHCMVAQHFVCQCGDAFTSYAKLDIHRDDCLYSN